MSGTVELLNGADEKMFVELIRAPQVHDVHREDSLTIRCAIELDAVVTDVLVNVQR